MKPGYKRSDWGPIPQDWDIVLLDELAKRGSGHTPDKKHPEYWGGDIKWISLADSPALDRMFIDETFAKITPAGITNSSAVLHPAGTVVLSRDAGVGKSAIMRSEMAVSQHFIVWACGPDLVNRFLYYWFQYRKAAFERIANGTTIKTIGLHYFKNLTIPKLPLVEQSAIATALSDADTLLEGLERLIAKKRDLKQAAMQQLLSGQTRLPGFTGEWEVKSLRELGSTYGGLTGKTKADFGHGSARYVTFMNVISNVRIDCESFEPVSVLPSESQNRVEKGDLLFNGSSETPEEVALCGVIEKHVPRLFLNSFCFGFRFHPEVQVSGLFIALYLRSREGREMIKSLAQGSTRYNLSKAALLQSTMRMPEFKEQTAIAAVLTDMDAELNTLEQRLAKTRDLKQAMMQELLTGRTRLFAAEEMTCA